MSARDLRGVLRLAGELGQVDDLVSLRSAVLTHLRTLVGSDVSSWNELSLEAGRASINAVEPAEAIVEDADEQFAAVAHQNPLIAATRSPGVVSKFSDHLSQRQLHRLDIYDVAYRPFGLEHQVAWWLPAPAGETIGIALNRCRGDFSERDRSVLEVAAPLIAGAHRHLLMIEALRRGGADRLDPAVLDRAGLAHREREVLALVARGDSNIQIAQQLQISERTVAKHLEHVYAKLGVSNRTAAVASARGEDLAAGASN